MKLPCLVAAALLINACDTEPLKGDPYGRLALDFASMFSPEAPAFQYETKDRLPPEKLARMVAGPAALLEQGKLVEAERAFAQLIARKRASSNGSGSVEADYHMAWALALFEASLEDGWSATDEAAVRHLRISASLYERNFGKNHPETALALATLADAMDQRLAPNSLAERTELFRRVAAIREETLGPHNIETVASWRSYLRLLVHPEQQDRADFEQALEIANRLISDPQIKDDSLTDMSRTGTYAYRAVALLRLHRTAEGIASMNDYWRLMQQSTDSDDHESCLKYEDVTKSFFSALNASDGGPDTEALRQRDKAVCDMDEWPLLRIDRPGV